MNVSPINWSLISRSVEFYKSKRYEHIEVPWLVSKETAMITCPFEVSISECGNMALVGSAEQGFLEIAKSLKPGKYVSTSPCFRNDLEDYFHQRYFVKTELFVTDPNVTLDEVINDAMSFFLSLNDDNLSIINIDTNSLDIMLNGVEIGSYGIREHGDIKWIYGTGIAEPRYSRAKALWTI